jgi:arachidonate 15-lipoxygenase
LGNINPHFKPQHAFSDNAFKPYYLGYFKMTNAPTPEKYKYRHDAFAAIDPSLKYPMAEAVLFADKSLTKGKWTKDVVSLLLRVQSNQAMHDIAVNKDFFSSVKKLFWYLRLSMLLKDPKNMGWIGFVYKVILEIYQKIFILFGKTPKSENISYDLEKVNSKNKIDPNGINILEKRITSMVKDAQKQASSTNVGSNIQDYRDLFQIIYLPNIANHVEEDQSFAAQRVAGANPLVIERLTSLLDKFPVTDGHYQSVMGDSDSLQRALDDKRLYITDYQVLENIETREIEPGKNEVQKFIYHPIALFAVEPGNCPNRRLVPVAIQCYQQPSSDNPIFVAPSPQASDSERWAWQIAKLTVQIADANHHELISHLGGTHLWMEPIAIAIYRKLPLEHPLGALLRPHVEGTLFINNAAVRGLINVGGTVDKVASGTLRSSLLLSVQGATGYPFPFNKSFLPMTLQSRGVDDPQLLPNYPYRDDALLIWEAIHLWVASYLKIFYADDQAVQNNLEIQDWIRDLTDSQGGQMMGIKETADDSTIQIKTLAYLIDVVTLIIFTGSAQHAAVNFPQSSWMTYMPNMPLAGYRAAPQTTVGVSEKDYFEMLPSLEQSENQMNMTYLLGSIYYTQLGQYDGDPQDKKPVSYFKDDRVAQPLQEFQERLRTIELEIKARNEVRAIHYDVLLPPKIPQSINI